MRLLVVWIISAASMVAVIPGYAANHQSIKRDIAKCSVIKGQLSRLQCFDNLSMSLGLNGPQQGATNLHDIGKWHVDKESNPLNDSKTVILMLTADSGVSEMGSPVVLFLRCQDNQTDVFINWNAVLAGSEALGDDSTSVTYRIGQNQAITNSWPQSTNNEATFYPGNKISLIKKMMTTNQFVAQVTPFDANPITAVFDTSGLSRAIKPLRQDCHW